MLFLFDDLRPTFWTGIVLWAAGFAGNILHDEVLLNIRRRARKKSDDGKEHYAIPHGYLYRYVSYPNYLCEWMEWTGYAIAAAPNTAQGWGAHRADGGLAWSTYKAVVRRDGAYTSASAGFRDFNNELVDPILKQLATGWERAFQHRLPRVFETYTKDSGRILEKFHETIEQRARENGVGLANISVLKNQLYTYGQLFNELGAALIVSMNELQRNANRDFTPTVVAIMHSVYEECTEERGKIHGFKTGATD